MVGTVENIASISEKLLREFEVVHGNKYSYSNAVYVNTHTPIEIHCSEHGAFFQIPRLHRSGQGCPTCGKKIKRNISQDAVISSFKQRHGEKFDYSKVVYKKCSEKVTIICPNHGEFQQTPSAHKNGQGCPRCSGRGKTQEDLILEFQAIHGDKFDYSKVVYVNATTKVVIVCKEHGEFQITPNGHLQGKSCRLCKK